MRIGLGSDTLSLLVFLGVTKVPTRMKVVALKVECKLENFWEVLVGDQ